MARVHPFSRAGAPRYAGPSTTRSRDFSPLSLNLKRTPSPLARTTAPPAYRDRNTALVESLDVCPCTRPKPRQFVQSVIALVHAAPLAFPSRQHLALAHKNNPRKPSELKYSNEQQHLSVLSLALSFTYMAESVGVSELGPVRKTVVTLQICELRGGQKCFKCSETFHGMFGGSGREGSRAPTQVSDLVVAGCRG